MFCNTRKKVWYFKKDGCSATVFFCAGDTRCLGLAACLYAPKQVSGKYKSLYRLKQTRNTLR